MVEPTQLRNGRFLQTTFLPRDADTQLLLIGLSVDWDDVLGCWPITIGIMCIMQRGYPKKGVNIFVPET